MRVRAHTHTHRRNSVPSNLKGWLEPEAYTASQQMAINLWRSNRMKEKGVWTSGAADRGAVTLWGNEGDMRAVSESFLM